MSMSPQTAEYLRMTIDGMLTLGELSARLTPAEHSEVTSWLERVRGLLRAGADGKPVAALAEKLLRELSDRPEG
jgi:hypothetical protein